MSGQLRMNTGIFAACSLLMLSLSATAAQINVPGDYDTIQAGIDAANPGDEVIVGAGTHTGAGNRDLFIDSAITVRSADGPAMCIIDAEGVGRGFLIVGDATVEGFTVTNGFSATQGGGMLIENSNATVRDCWFVDNLAKWTGDEGSIGRGGALYVDGGTVLVEDCDFTNNVAEAVNPDSPPFPDVAKGLGGAVIFSTGAVGTVRGSHFAGNQAVSPGLGGNSIGGAMIVASGCDVTVETSTFSNNFASIAGGAMWVQGSFAAGNELAVVTVTDSVFSGNSAQSAGAIAGFELAVLNVSGCEFSDNYTLEDIVFVVPGTQEEIGGGAIGAVLFSFATIEDSLFVGNESRAGRGGAVSGSWGSTTSIAGSEFYGNSAALVGGAVNNGGVPSLAGGGATMTLDHCVLGCNAAPIGGGVANVEGSALMVENGTLGHNDANDGGGIANMNPGSTTSVHNSILWGNHAEDGPQGSQILDGPGGVGVTWSIVQRGWTGVGNLRKNPRWADADENQCPDGNDYSLSRNSPARGAGEGGVDMGAFPYVELLMHWPVQIQTATPADTTDQ